MIEPVTYVCVLCVMFMCGFSVCICDLVRSKTSSGQGEKSARDGSSQRVPRQVSATRGQKSAKSSGSSSSSSQLTSNWSSSWIKQHIPNLLQFNSVFLLMKVPVELEEFFSLSTKIVKNIFSVSLEDLFASNSHLAQRDYSWSMPYFPRFSLHVHTQTIWEKHR